MQWHSLKDLGYSSWSLMPEDVPQNYHDAVKQLIRVRKKLKNPISSVGYPRPLMPATIRGYKSDEQELLDRIGNYKKLIKQMLKYNILPLSKIIPDKDKLKFIFTLGAMVEFPFLGKVVSSANELVRGNIEERDRNCCLLISTLKDSIKALGEKKAFYSESRLKSFKDKKCQTCRYFPKGGRRAI